MKKKILIPIFFSLVACVWILHLNIHCQGRLSQLNYNYQEIEKGGRYATAHMGYVFYGVAVMLIYIGLIAINIISAFQHNIRFVDAIISGSLFLIITFVHLFALLLPSDFYVFGSAWSKSESVREIMMAFSVGVSCIAVAIYSNRFRASDSTSN